MDSVWKYKHREGSFIGAHRFPLEVPGSENNHASNLCFLVYLLFLQLETEIMPSGDDNVHVARPIGKMLEPYLSDSDCIPCTSFASTSR